MSTPRIGHRGRQLTAAVAAALAVAAVVLIVVATMAQKHAASPSPSAARPASERSVAPIAPASPAVPGGPAAPHQPTTATKPGSQTSVSTGPVLARSVPVALDVPEIGIRQASLVELGLAGDGSIQVPPVGAGSPAGWFRGSPTPGQLGPAVVLGHVDSAAAGPAIFYRLGALQPGQSAMVTRADGTVAVFRIDSVEKYSKDSFPTLQVFGNTDQAALRLITCGGTFNPSKHSYEDNIVVYAHLTSSHPA